MFNLSGKGCLCTNHCLMTRDFIILQSRFKCSFSVGICVECFKFEFDNESLYMNNYSEQTAKQRSTFHSINCSIFIILKLSSYTYIFLIF